MKELKPREVIHAIRLKTNKDRVIVDHLLTFSSSILPSQINVAFYKLKVRPYCIPLPVRCFNYQLFGHAQICQSIKISTCTIAANLSPLKTSNDFIQSPRPKSEFVFTVYSNASKIGLRAT